MRLFQWARRGRCGPEAAPRAIGGGRRGMRLLPLQNPYTPAAAFSPQSLPKVRAQARLWPPTVTGYSTR